MAVSTGSQAATIAPSPLGAESVGVKPQITALLWEGKELEHMFKIPLSQELAKRLASILPDPEH